MPLPPTRPVIPSVSEESARRSALRPPEPRTLIIGVGNPHRGDDAAGLLTARLLRDRCPADVEVIESTGETAELIDLWNGADLVVLIDAVSTDAPPGTVLRFAVGIDPLPAGFTSFSTHAFGLAEAIALAETLGRLPTQLIVFGIAGSHFETGASIDPTVAAALAEAAFLVLAEVGRWLTASPS
jgi:hydrogenase maturation protease